jgi:hypothetical protein
MSITSRQVGTTKSSQRSMSGVVSLTAPNVQIQGALIRYAAMLMSSFVFSCCTCAGPAEPPPPVGTSEFNPGTSEGCPLTPIRQPLPVPTISCSRPPAIQDLLDNANGDMNRAADLLRNHLENRGYDGNLRQFLLSDGDEFGLLFVATPEVIDENGRPREGAERWVNVGMAKPFGLGDIIRAILVISEARARSILITLTRSTPALRGDWDLQTFQELARCPSNAWSLPSANRQIVTTVLVYEFVKYGAMQARVATPSESRVLRRALISELELGSCP